MLTTFKNNFQDKFNSTSFKVKAIVAAVSIAIIPVLGVGVLSYFVSQSNLREAEVTSQKFAANTLATDIARFLTLRGKDIQTLSFLPIFTTPKITSISSSAEKDVLLDKFLDNYKFYSSIMWLDVNGNPLAASKGSVRENHADRDYFQATLKTGQPQITRIEKSKSTGEYAFYITAPTRNSLTGQITGVVRARLPVTALTPIAAPFAEGGSDWHIADNKTGKYVLVPKDEKATDATEFSSFNKFKNSAKPASDFNYSSVTKETELTSFIKIPTTVELPDLNLSVVMSKHMDLIYAQENKVLIIILLGTLSAGGTTIGLSLLLSNRVTDYIKQMAETISKSSSAIVDTVEMQELTVNMQANSAIETSNTVNDLGEISFQSAAQAEASATGASLALSLAEEGTKSVQQTLQGMDSLRQKVDDIAQQIVNLSEQTGQITVVSDLVADLASQTNMLALNAAVEAARAGEQGKGFSVVASEIRKLADQSKKSADKINALATDIQAAINRTVMVTDEGTKTVKEGIDLAEGTATTFLGVTDRKSVV